MLFPWDISLEIAFSWVAELKTLSYLVAILRMKIFLKIRFGNPGHCQYLIYKLENNDGGMPSGVAQGQRMCCKGVLRF